MSVVFWLGAGLLLFAFAGYPAWVLAQARLRPRPVALADVTPAVTAILAVHDAGDAVRDKLLNLLALDYPECLFDIVVACDGCTDGTADACRSIGSDRITVLEFDTRRGKSACLNDAVARARGEVLLMVDVRQVLDPATLRLLVRNLGDPGVGAVSGRLAFRDVDGGFAASVDAYWRYESLVRAAEGRSGSVVGVTGALYAVRRRLFPRLPDGTVLDDVLVPMAVAKSGHRVVIEPAAIAWDRPSQDARAERARKVRTLAGNYQLVRIAPWLLLPGTNPLWFRFVSHKLLRLAAPWLTLAVGVSALALAPRDGFYAACLAALLGCLGAVLAGKCSPAVARLLPVRLLTAYWHMNAYAARALFAFASRRRLHLW